MSMHIRELLRKFVKYLLVRCHLAGENALLNLLIVCVLLKMDGVGLHIFE